MACSCHGKMGARVRYAAPEDQCTMCARKHVKNAWSKWNEFTYEEDNRDYCSAQLRDAADHLKFDHRETALKLRDLAVAIEENRDKEYADVADELNKLREETRALFYTDHPEAEQRLADLKNRRACRASRMHSSGIRDSMCGSLRRSAITAMEGTASAGENHGKNEKWAMRNGKADQRA
ncbi:MAG: hypothetical protein ACI4UV_17290 [Victivallales bacterium]